MTESLLSNQSADQSLGTAEHDLGKQAKKKENAKVTEQKLSNRESDYSSVNADEPPIVQTLNTQKNQASAKKSDPAIKTDANRSPEKVQSKTMSNF